MTRRMIPLTTLLFLLMAPALRAQVPFSRDLIPTRTSMSRLGLEQNWSGVVPLGIGHERVLLATMTGDMLFAQTNQANLHAYDAETGRYLWGTNLGSATNVAHEPSVNSDRVIVANGQFFLCLDKGTGRFVWKATLDDLANTATACDEERAIVGLRNGKMVAYSIRDHSKDTDSILTTGVSAGTFLWAWKTNAPLTGRPVPTQRVVAFGSQDSRVYVARIDETKLIFRYLTNGPISASLGTLGTRTLLIPSQDHNLYAIDLFNGETRWIYPSGSPILQEPLVAEVEIFIENEQGELASVDAKTGTAKWVRDTGQSTLVSVSPSRVYLKSRDGDLLIVDRATGRLLADAASTLDRAGLKLREFSLYPTNRFNDRVYMVTPSGLVVSFREAGRTQPQPLRDPQGPPFGYIPDDDEVPTPPETPAAGDLFDPFDPFDQP